MKTYVSPATPAILYTALNDRDKAFQSLEKAYLEGDPQVRSTGVGYEYDGLREAPALCRSSPANRFGAIKHRVFL